MADLSDIVQLEDITVADLQAGKVYRKVEDATDESNVLGLEEVNVGDCVPSCSGSYLISGKVRLADGSEHLALLDIDTDASGEPGGVVIKTETGWATQGTDDFLDALKRTQEQVFPYEQYLSIPVEFDVHQPDSD